MENKDLLFSAITLAKTLGFSDADISVLDLAMRKCLAEEEARAALLSAYTAYRDTPDEFVLSAHIKPVSAWAESAGIHPYTGNMLLLLLLATRLRERYGECGLSDAQFLLLLADLTYKCEECKLVKGVVGTFVPDWYRKFFTLDLLAFGRLQFEAAKLAADCTVSGHFLKKGTPMLSVHIPRTGTPLSHDAVLASYDEAAQYYQARFSLSPAVFVCSSWLLFPHNEKLLKPTSNILAFMRDYTILDWGFYNGYGELWRIFDKEYTGNPDDLPADTSLRRAYIDLVKRGEKTGWGYGVIAWE